MPLPVLIIGAGPYGVSIALDLHRRGLPFVICGEPFELWYRHTLTAVSLRSDIHVSEVFTKDRRHRLDRYIEASLPATDALRIRKGRVPVGVFREYLRHVQSNLPFPILRTRVTSLERDGDDFNAATADQGMIRASQVVLACGVDAHRHLPECLVELASERVVHGWQVQRYESARDQSVLVVGSGQSAAEAVWHLRPHNRVTWVHRTSPTFYADLVALPRPIFALAMRGSHIFSMMPNWLRTRLRTKLGGTTITPDLKQHLEDVNSLSCDVQNLQLVNRGNLVYSSQMNQEFDLVIACTGYRHALKNLSMLSRELISAVRCDGAMPVLDRCFQTSVPGLYVVGAMAEPKHGPAMRFMSGTRTAVMLVGAAVARRFADRFSH
jgi:thioredoxin reductase